MNKYFDRRCTTCGALHIDCWERSDAPVMPCRTCGAPTERVWLGKSTAVKSDEWPGGKVFEHGFPEPTRFCSPSAYRKALAARGLAVRGDGEEQTAWISKQALESAKELVTRCTS